MNTRRNGLSLLSAAIAAALLSAPLAHAQNAPADQNATTSTASSGTVTTLGTIVVTANRRDETLQKVPMAVSALTFHDIQRQHLQDFSDYAANVPGLDAITLGPGMTELSIRGIASGSQQPSASVGVYVDETPFGSSSVFAVGSALTPDLDPADVERIEVLRGPQGTLYGAGALGGVIRFITIPPDTETYSGRVQVGGSSVDGGGNGFDVHGMFNLPLVKDKLAIRANVYDETDPGFVDDAGRGKTDINESKIKGGRVSLLWTPTDRTSVRVTALAQNLSAAGSATVALDPDTLQPVYGDLQQRSAELGGDAFDAHYRLYNVTLNTDFGWAKLMSSTSYSTLDAVTNTDATSLLFLGPQRPGGPYYGTLEQAIIPQTKATQEFRLSSPKSQTVEWLGGVFWTRETGNNAQNVYASDYYSGTPLPSPLGIPIGGDLQPSTYEAYAAYGSITWHVTDRFDLEAGLRYSHDKQHYTEIGYGLLFGGVPPTVLLDKRSSDSSTTFSLTPTFHIDDNHMLYARIASGFLPGGPNIVPVGVPNVPATFSPTKLTNYELGLKSTSADDRLMVDLSAYYIDWTKIPLTTFENNFTFLTSGGQAQSKGLEATVAWIPAQGLRLSANAAYNDATLTKDAPYPSNGKRGDPLPYAPQFTLGLNGDYDFALGGGWHGYVGASYRYVDERSTDFAFSYPIPGVLPPLPSSPTIPGYHTIDLRAGVNRDQWNIDVYVKNLTNQRGIVQASTFQNYVPVAGELNPVTGRLEDNATIITPRMFGISVSRNF
ncbi:MAG TPA: TonB-dependent receptor [Rhodanobacteraceae bacterium]|jgi:outer membrane receptor protein involved in Fe transport|nr:TonB-dependent receptor [Rhodanobacteraceae bacterium]